ncbi:MAG TPA: DUF2298 domain-containing protein [Bdellovibrionota bacterium]|nr:DUF2298 domain-containing protein [Bdellovibrionota bacterium]
MDDFAAAGRWITVLAILQLATERPARRIFGRQGGALGLPLFLLLWSYVYWLWGSLTGLPPGNSPTYVSAVVAYGFLFFGSRTFPIATPRANGSAIGGVVTFWIILAVAIGLRMFAPELEQTEKFADLSVFQGVLLDRHFPPEDRWLSGIPLNYYYYGHLLFVPITRAAGVPPEWAFNLSLCTVMALLGSSAYAWVRQISQNRLCAAGSALVSTLLSNVEWIRQWVTGRWTNGFSWWGSSRTMPGTITEFPYFSFLVGDLHAHYLALPWVTLTFALVFSLRSALRNGDRLLSGVLIFFTGLAVGLHYPLNPWEIPWLALFVVLVLFRFWWAVAVVGGTAFITYLPFWLSFVPRSSSIHWVPAELHSPVPMFLAHWALFLVPLLFLFFRIVSYFSIRQKIRILGITVGIVLFGGGAAAICGFFLTGAWFWKNGDWEEPEDALLLWSLLAIATCEFIYLYEFFGPEYRRINTVFKFYMLAWSALAICVPLLIWRHRKLFFYYRRSSVALLVVVIAAGCVYPVAGTWARTGGFRGVKSLDGMAHWDRLFPGEREIVRWLRDHTAPNDHILEAEGDSYQRDGRFAAFSGRPTILAWMQHTGVWRPDGYALMGPRQADLKQLRGSPTPELLNQFVRKYRIRYIVVGALERQSFPAPLLETIARYPVSFSSSTARVYEVP